MTFIYPSWLYQFYLFLFNRLLIILNDLFLEFPSGIYQINSFIQFHLGFLTVSLGIIGLLSRGLLELVIYFTRIPLMSDLLHFQSMNILVILFSIVIYHIHCSILLMTVRMEIRTALVLGYSLVIFRVLT